VGKREREWEREEEKGERQRGGSGEESDRKEGGVICVEEEEEEDAMVRRCGWQGRRLHGCRRRERRHKRQRGSWRR